MKLSEIAEYIADNYPESNIAYNNDVIKGCREEWYEESLIDPLLDFYMHEELGLCGCGNPEFTYETIGRYLSIRNEFIISKIDYQEVINRYKNAILGIISREVTTELYCIHTLSTILISR